ncbi:hypothetical protein B0H13DRAFT_1901278 [Mycena leptocephala]|nr:hypothetical protein B0H13DRAFT_1901278 [Mycena leptocephala]
MYAESATPMRKGLLESYREALLHMDSNCIRLSHRRTTPRNSMVLRHTTKMDVAGGAELDSKALQVRTWRRKLQKIFLDKAAPNLQKMPEMDAEFTAIENFEGMTLDYLVFSKLPKVLRHIHRLKQSQVPRDEDYNFRSRANALVEKWYLEYQHCV